MKAPMAPEYYDRIFTRVDDYRAHYRDSRYFVLWTQVLQFLRRVPSPKILEIGCGPGQFAHYLYDQGFRDYHGFDFSPEAIRRARENSPQSFEVGDAMDPDSYKRDYNVAIALEVLEHVQDDLGLLANLRPGTVLFFSLPTFDDEAHVRFFPQPRQIVERYEPRVDLRRLLALEVWYVGAGVVRSSVGPAATGGSFDLLGRLQDQLMGARQ